MHLGAQDLGYQRQLALIDEQMVFAVEVAMIGRVSAHILATARRNPPRYHGVLFLDKLPEFSRQVTEAI